MSLPRYLPAFITSKFSEGQLVRHEVRDVGPDGQAGDLLAEAQREADGDVVGLSFFSGTDPTCPVFSWRVREVGAFDVFDDRGEAIGYFRPDHLSAPYLEATGTWTGPGRTGRLEFRDDTYPVMTVESRSPSGLRAVTVPDRRLAVRIAAAVATELDTRRGI